MSSPYLTSKLLPVPHGFSTRHGGVSQGAFLALNLGHRVGDEPLHVRENFQRLAGAAGLPLERLFTVSQVHGDRVLAVAGSARAATEPEGEADALWTQSDGAWVGVKTADCVPVLLVDPVRRRVAAVHSGWRGTDARIAARAVEALVAEGSDPAKLLAAVGPAIGPCCYEVSFELGERFRRAWGDEVVRAGGGGPRLDLPTAVRRTLMQAGLPPGQVDVLTRCTQCEAKAFFSHRRDRGVTGRHLSFVACRF